MITSVKNRYSLLWLTGFLVTGGVWTYLGGHAFAQNAGTLTINTGNLVVSDGTSISVNPSRMPIADISGFGNAGDITITATSLVLNSLGGIVTIGDDSSGSSGSAGTITINTRLVVSDGTSISVDPSTVLTSNDRGGGSLNPGGNITLTVKDLLLIRRDGNLTTDDGSLFGVNPSNPVLSAGGNITINAGSFFIRSVPEPSSTLGLLAFAVVGTASIYKFKQRSKVVF